MCYFLYGAVNKGVDANDYAAAMKDAEYQFSIGSKHDVKLTVGGRTQGYRVTDAPCDCDTAVGAGNPEHAEIAELQSVLLKLKSVRGIRCVYLSKNWVGKINRREAVVRLGTIDVKQFLADLQENCLYTIEYQTPP